jgi:EAL domain-containing protein (putative c-di-GMP-specific phosphodiesterase class I)
MDSSTDRERENLVTELGEHMFGLACATAVAWESRGLGMEVAINISLLHFSGSEVADRLLAILAKTAVDASRIVVEVTESTPAAEAPDAVAALARLASAGITVSIDDFGSGNSTEHRVTSLPATEVKIDQSIVQDNSANGRGALAFLIQFGRSRNLRVVAEGVSTDDQLERVRALGCDRAQGYLLGRPMPLAELNALLAQPARSDRSER